MKKKNFAIYFLIVSIVFLLSACEKDEHDLLEVEDDTLLTSDSVSGIDTTIDLDFFIQEEFNSQLVFTNDKLFREKILQGVLNNLGVGYDSDELRSKLSVFQKKPNDSILDYTIDEYNGIHTVYAFDKLCANKLQDSIIQHFKWYDTSFALNLPTNKFEDIINQTDSTLYVNLIYTKSIGNVQIDLNNPELNSYLRFPSSLFNNTNKDSINISAASFNAMYGDAICMSFSPGVFLNVEFEIHNVHYEATKKSEIMHEVADLFTKYRNGEASWQELTNESEFFKDSDIYSFNKIAIPRLPSIFDDVTQNISYLDSIYKNADVGILATQYKPYSVIYPQFKFEQ